MRGQPTLGMIYLTFFILLIAVGGYWILHSNTWFDYNILYGPATRITGTISRIDDACGDQNKTLLMLNTGSSQAYVYMGFKPDILPGDQVTVTVYNVTGRGILFDLMRAGCEPAGFHYYAIKLYSSRLFFETEGQPWKR